MVSPNNCKVRKIKLVAGLSLTIATGVMLCLGYLVWTRAEAARTTGFQEALTLLAAQTDDRMIAFVPPNVSQVDVDWDRSFDEVLNQVATQAGIGVQRPSPGVVVLCRPVRQEERLDELERMEAGWKIRLASTWAFAQLLDQLTPEQIKQIAEGKPVPYDQLSAPQKQLLAKAVEVTTGAPAAEYEARLKKKWQRVELALSPTPAIWMMHNSKIVPGSPIELSSLPTVGIPQESE